MDYLYEMERPLVSVVMGTYNGEKYLAEQVDSILNQTYRPLELIISDDASADNTRQVLKLYESNPLVRIFYQEKNLGLTKNFSFAAMQAKGDLIAFSDQDDIWMSNKIEKLVEEKGNYHLVYSNSLMVDETGRSMNKKLSDLKKMYTGDDSRGYILYSCVWGHSMMISKDLLQKSLPMPGEVNHDIWITYMAFQLGGIKYVDEVLTHYRRNLFSVSQDLARQKSLPRKDNLYEVFKKKLQWIELMGQYERKKYQPFYQELRKLYAMKEKKNYVFSLFSFMLKYQKEIFRLSKKGFLSKTWEIFKQARGVRL
jgi:glycosyltransferase involved in cell wall biosynthesis